MSKKILSAEFKRECAELVINHGYKHGDAAKAMDVSISSMQRWVSQYRKEQRGITPKPSALTPEANTHSRIRKTSKAVKK